MWSRAIHKALFRKPPHLRGPLPALSRPCLRKVHRGRALRNGVAVELTAVRYPEVKRGNFSQLEDRHIKQFESILGEGRVWSEPSDVDPFNIDWLKMVRGQGKVVLKPKTTEEVSAILNYCHEETLAVCPQGGNTSVSGGSVPVFDEVIISTALMNRIISFDELSGVIVCQAGCVLEQLQNYVSERGFTIPLDLGAKGSCHIGGNISTNAGGIRVIRYGSLHGSVLGVEAVKADGEIVDCLNTLRKDNTGYHLKHLFIGSEGTLGFVTKVAIQCPSLPKAVSLAFLGMNSFDDALKTSKRARRDLGEVLSACEVMDQLSIDSVTSLLNLRNPIDEYPFYMILETSGSNGTHDEAKLNAFLDSAMSSGEVLDGTVATEPSRVQSLWQLRERIAEALLHDGYNYLYDITLPLKDFYAIIPELRKRLAGHRNFNRCCGFGHLGDGNLHIQITSKEFDQEIHDLIEPFLFEWTSSHKGSVSSEHGIGFKKTKFIHFSKSPSSLNLMYDIKKVMDPKGIMNPYKVLPKRT